MKSKRLELLNRTIGTDLFFIAMLLGASLFGFIQSLGVSGLWIQIPLTLTVFYRGLASTRRVKQAMQSEDEDDVDGLDADEFNSKQIIWQSQLLPNGVFFEELMKPNGKECILCGAEAITVSFPRYMEREEFALDKWCPFHTHKLLEISQ